MAELRLEPCGAVNPSVRLRRNGSPGSGETPWSGDFQSLHPLHAPQAYRTTARFRASLCRHAGLFRETNLIKRDEIAARQLHALRQHYAGKLRLTDVKETFLEDEGPSVMIVRSLRGGTSPKSRVANALARLAGIKGGRARAKKLSAEKRSEIAKKAATDPVGGCQVDPLRNLGRSEIQFPQADRLGTRRGRGGFFSYLAALLGRKLLSSGPSALDAGQAREGIATRDFGEVPPRRLRTIMTDGPASSRNVSFTSVSRSLPASAASAHEAAVCDLITLDQIRLGEMGPHVLDKATRETGR